MFCCEAIDVVRKENQIFRGENQMTRLSLVLCLALAVTLSCGKEENNQAQVAPQSAPQNSPKTIIVRVNSQTGQKDFTTYPGVIDQNQLQQMDLNSFPWQPVGQDQLINSQNGYPRQWDSRPMFVEQPGQYQAPGGQQQQYGRYTWNPYGYNNNYYGCAGTYGCGYGYGYGYNNYPNYYGYQNPYYSHYYAPQYNNYGGYSYLPAYYYNNSYWYYQPYNNWRYNMYQYYAYQCWW